MIDKKNILGVGVTNASKEEVLEYISKSLENFKKKYFIVTPNPEFLILANKNPNYKNILNRAELALTDGIGVILAAKILGKSLKERFTGIELLESLCKIVVRKPITVGFLGGGLGVAEKTAECLRLEYPHLKIVFAAAEWPEGDFVLENQRGKTQNTTPNSTEKVNSVVPRTVQHGLAMIDILFVAFGAPKQEIWISENLENLPVKIAIGVGGAFDYVSGKVHRAPVWIQNIGFEWLYRLIRQPWRIKRQFSLLKFAWLVLKEKLGF